MIETLHMREERDKKEKVRRGQQTESVETGKALSISENRLIKTGEKIVHTQTQEKMKKQNNFLA